MTATTPPLEGTTRLHQLGIIRVTGADATTFLHSQLTQDFALLGLQHARLAAWLNPKGRMLASFIGLKCAADDVLLVCAQDLLAPTLQRLSMFVLRAKAQLSDASAHFQLWGLAGQAALAVLPPNAQPWSRADHASASAIQLYPANGCPRALWLAPADNPPPHAAPLAAALWQWSEVRSGVATITAPVIAAFVPQMLNYESVGGVNFKKGCYPGQEVVARSQFRGTLKRRTYLAHLPCPPGQGAAIAAGTEVFVQHGDDGDAGQPVGTIVQAAATPNGGGIDALVALPIAATEHALHAGGHTMVLLPLPYALLQDI